jgi:hypothetical protein
VNTLKRKFVESDPSRAIVQRTVAQLTWRTKLARIEELARLAVCRQLKPD